MDNESYQDKIDYTVLVFVDTGTQTKRKVRSALCSYLIYCSNHFMTRFDSNAACIFAICVWYLYKINKNSTNYSPKSSACGGQVFLKMYYFSACGGQNQGGLCVEWGGLAKTEPDFYLYIYIWLSSSITQSIYNNTTTNQQQQQQYNYSAHHHHHRSLTLSHKERHVG